MFLKRSQEILAKSGRLAKKSLTKKIIAAFPLHQTTGYGKIVGGDYMKDVTIYTDGACSGNPGAGGWGTILSYNGREKELCGAEKQTTNNRMELTAVIEGLRALKEPCRVLIVTDSQYVVNGIEKGWAKSWKANGWRKKDKKPALNPDLWDALLGLLDKHEVRFQWIRGHDGHPQNERCDALAVASWTKIKEEE